jgi:NADH-quinone oxidoreductase subunit L
MVNGVARLVGFFGSVARLAQNGDVQRYAAFMALAAAAILASVIGVGGLS